MGFSESKEGLNLPKCHMCDFYEDLQSKLSLVAGIVPYESFGLKLEDIRKPMLVVGLPGIGKTCGIISIVKSINETLEKNGASHKLGFKKILLGQTVVGSMQGIPVSLPNGKVVRVQMPDLPDPDRDGEYGVLFLDEITTADEMQVQPALGLADDSRSLGEYTLPEHWVVVAAGNGPDCTNFIRLDDMTVSRFVGYDINYNYYTDFRPYAHASGLHQDLIAFLNFDPTACVKVESTDMDSAGKMFPCPRTWERLSIELKMREALGSPVPFDNMANFAGRIVGMKMGNTFGAFIRFKERLGYDIDKIINGTESAPDASIPRESCSIILQGILRKLTVLLDETGDGSGNYPMATYEKVSNAYRWFLNDNMPLDNKLSFFVEAREDLPALSSLMFDPDFLKMCPEVEIFFNKNRDAILANVTAINSGAF